MPAGQALLTGQMFSRQEQGAAGARTMLASGSGMTTNSRPRRCHCRLEVVTSVLCWSRPRVRVGVSVGGEVSGAVEDELGGGAGGLVVEVDGAVAGGGEGEVGGGLAGGVV